MANCLRKHKDRLNGMAQPGQLVGPGAMELTPASMLSPCKLITALILVVGLSSPGFSRAAGQQALDLARDMSAQAYSDAGLDRLTAMELAALHAWLRANTLPAIPASSSPVTPVEPPLANTAIAPAVVAPPSAPAVDTAESLGAEQLRRAKPPKPTVAAINTTILGDFRGWDGKTLFRLANGQVWQQRVRGRYRHRAEAPEVRIERGRFGYYLVVVGTDRQVGVKRVK